MYYKKQNYLNHLKVNSKKLFKLKYCDKYYQNEAEFLLLFIFIRNFENERNKMVVLIDNYDSFVYNLYQYMILDGGCNENFKTYKGFTEEHIGEPA